MTEPFNDNVILSEDFCNHQMPKEQYCIACEIEGARNERDKYKAELEKALGYLDSTTPFASMSEIEYFLRSHGRIR